jgi:hypothetical protein
MEGLYTPRKIGEDETVTADEALVALAAVSIAVKTDMPEDHEEKLLALSDKLEAWSSEQRAGA